ncbi:MAG: PHP-associated domain-containing protein [Phycisphaerae bacterium]
MTDLLSPVLEYERVDDAPSHRCWWRVAGRRIDLHCHSTFSAERVRWLPGLIFYPLLEPEELYDLAKARGMDFVTITDHDTIDGCKALLDRRGNLPDFIVGEEVTVSFPEDGTAVHVNIYDIDERQHAQIQRLRENVYEVVDLLKSIDKLFVLNHMTWTRQHRVLKAWQIEAMLELFPVFEGLNGTRSYAHNAFAWHATRGRGKVLVGGSDSHTNRVGTTYTLSEGETPGELLAAIRAGQAAPCGAFGTPEQLRDDVWLTLQSTVERHLMEASSAWKRATCHAVRRLGRFAYPFVCLGYHARQNLLIRKSLLAIQA